MVRLSELAEKAGIQLTTTTQPIVPNGGRRLSDLASQAGIELQALSPKEVEKPLKPIKGGVERFGEAGAKALKFGAETFIAPLAREVIRPFTSLKAGITGDVTPTKTPFGEVKPFSELTAKEAAISAAEVGTTVLPVEKILKPVGRLFKSIAKGLGGAFSGKGVAVIEKVIENPQAAKIGLRSDEAKVLKELSTEVRTGVRGLQKEASKAYGEAVDALPEKVDLSLSEIKAKLVKPLEKFGVVVDEKAKKFDFSSAPFVDSEEKILKKAFETVSNWKDFSPKGINELAIRIGKFRKSGVQSKELNSVVDSMKRNVRNALGDKIPAVKELNKEFFEKQDFLSAIESELSTKGAITDTKGIINTSKKIGSIFGGNKTLTRELVEELEEKVGIDILAKEAGRELAQAPSRAQLTIGDTVRSLLQVVIPPKVIGEIAAFTGIANAKLRPLMEIIKTFAPAERNALFNLFGGSSQSEPE